MNTDEKYGAIEAGVGRIPKFEVIYRLTRMLIFPSLLFQVFLGKDVKHVKIVWLLICLAFILGEQRLEPLVTESE